MAAQNGVAPDRVVRPAQQQVAVGGGTGGVGGLQQVEGRLDEAEAAPAGIDTVGNKGGPGLVNNRGKEPDIRLPVDMDVDRGPILTDRADQAPQVDGIVMRENEVDELHSRHINAA